jgi:outer membrane protein OmpA-like peptidoglycan-associated protein
MASRLVLALLGASLVSLAGCAVPDRQPDLDVISANVAQTQEGDFGEVLMNLNEAGDKAREAQEIYDDLMTVPPTQNADLNERERAVQLSEEAAEHRRRAEAALNRILDARLAYLESLHAPQGTGAMSKSVFFDTGSAALDDEDKATLAASLAYLSQYPISHVAITGYADTEGSAEANRALAQRRADAVAAWMRASGAPMALSVVVLGAGEPDGAADGQSDPNNRRVDVLVAPHGTFQ